MPFAFCVTEKERCGRNVIHVHVHIHVSPCFVFPGEVAKLQNHLSLLREEYVKLQNRLSEVEKKYQIAVAASGQGGDDNFVARLLRTVSDLFDKELYRYIFLFFLRNLLKYMLY